MSQTKPPTLALKPQTLNLERPLPSLLLSHFENTFLKPGPPPRVFVDFRDRRGAQTSCWCNPPGPGSVLQHHKWNNFHALLHHSPLLKINNTKFSSRQRKPQTSTVVPGIVISKNCWIMLFVERDWFRRSLTLFPLNFRHQLIRSRCARMVLFCVTFCWQVCFSVWDMQSFGVIHNFWNFAAKIVG